MPLSLCPQLQLKSIVETLASVDPITPTRVWLVVKCREDLKIQGYGIRFEEAAPAYISSKIEVRSLDVSDRKSNETSSSFAAPLAMNFFLLPKWTRAF